MEPFLLSFPNKSHSMIHFLMEYMIPDRGLQSLLCYWHLHSILAIKSILARCPKRRNNQKKKKKPEESIGYELYKIPAGKLKDTGIPEVV